ncbi:unnamed protein product, partial [Ixodes pacificus]
VSPVIVEPCSIAGDDDVVCLFRHIVIMRVCLLALSSSVGAARPRSLVSVTLQKKETTNVSSILRAILSPRAALTAFGNRDFLNTGLRRGLFHVLGQVV